MTIGVRRFLQGMFALLSGSIALSIIVAAVKDGKPAVAAAALIPLLFGAAVIAIFEYQIRSYRKAGKVVEEMVAACAKSVFDAPSTIYRGYNLEATATSAAMAVLGAESNAESAFTTDGTYGGAKVSVASHVSVVGRQMGEFHHTYSHVLVDVLGLEKPFRVAKERAGAFLGKAIGMKDAQTGDKAFDDTFLVSTDDEFARAVLDDSIRKRMLGLQDQVKSVSTDFGAISGMNITLTRHGLALRWPGDIDPKLAASVRDLLLDMRANMLAFENRKAARAGAAAGTGYRVATDDAPPAEALPPAVEEPLEVGARNRE